MSFIFNINIDASDAENPIIKDVNTYPVHDIVRVVNNTPNPGVGDTITLEDYTANADIKKAKVGKFTGAALVSEVLGIKDIFQTGVGDADAAIELYDSLSQSIVDIEVELLYQSDNTNQEAINRPEWVLFSYLTAKPSAGDVSVDLVNTSSQTASEWTFNTDDGGWFVLKIYAIRRFDNSTDGSAAEYSEDDLVFEIQSDLVVVYRSLVDSNAAALDDEDSWAIVQTATDVDVLTRAQTAVTAESSTVDEYVANIFISRKLEDYIDDMAIKADCKCLDVCDFPDLLKLSMYNEQIKALITRKNYTKAQETYEKALQLAQNNS